MSTGRRRFLQLSATGVLGWTGCSVVALPSRPAFEQLAFQDVGAAQLHPEWTGTIEPTALESLWALFEAIRTHWGLDGPDPDPSRRRQWFEDVVSLKTELPPGYLAEYRSAASVVDAYRAAADAPAELAPLFSGPFSMEDAALTRLEHLRRYVVAEFIQLHLMRGGLLRLGYRAYRGHQAGLLSNRPYR